MRLLFESGLVNEDSSVLDYGCGRGDDVRFLKELGVQATGWDPYYAENEKFLVEAQIVNLGFVINVIEDPSERIAVLKNSFKYAKQCLSVAVMLPSQNDASHVIPYADGHITSTKTFQKYYEQAEILQLLKNTFSVMPIAAAPGVFFIFKDENAEQDYLLKRQLGIVRDYDPSRLEIKRKEKERLQAAKRELQDRKRAANLARAREFDRLAKQVAQQTLKMGRKPTLDELPSHIRRKLRDGDFRYATVFSAASRMFTAQELNAAVQVKKENLLLFFSMYLFSGRPKYNSLSASLQKDVRLYFTSMAATEKAAKEFLYSLGNDDLLHDDSLLAAGDSTGYLENDKLVLLAENVGKLPLRLRGLLSVANRISGQLPSHHIIKIHIKSKKITYLVVDDWNAAAIPRIIDRVIVDLKANSVVTISHSNRGEVKVFYLKSRLMAKDDKNFEAQSKFDELLQSIEGFSFVGEGPKFDDFANALLKKKIALPKYQ